MSDHQTNGLRKAVEIDRDDPIFAAFNLDPEQVAASLHRPRRLSRWLLLAIFGIIAPLVGFVVFHWPDMAHAATMVPVTNVQAGDVQARDVRAENMRAGDVPAAQVSDQQSPQQQIPDNEVIAWMPGPAL
jgi:hypothetical protein